MSTGSAVFVDTSIAIARVIHSAETKRRIEARLRQYQLSTTGDVVRQEFKRRLLKEAVYLLNQFEKHKSYTAVSRHVVAYLPVQQLRKRNICLEMLTTIHEGASDEELTERAKRYLRTLVRFGLADFDQSVGHVIRASGCACARQPIVERARYKRYDFGTASCSEAPTCNVIEFIRQRQTECESILAKIRSMPREKKTAEIQNAESFIEKVLHDRACAQGLDPCLTVGDLLIALESVGIKDFYTMNGKESQYYCRVLDQSMIVRKKNPIHDDVVCSNSNTQWPDF